MKADTRATFICILVLIAIQGSAKAQEREADAVELRSEPEASREEREPTAEDIRRALEAYEHEPSARELVEAIREDPTLDPAHARALARRGRRGGWLPWLRLSARRGQERDLSSRVEAEQTQVSTDDDLTLEASLTFRFDRAAYGPNEVALAREEGRRTLQRERRELALLEAFYERRRLQLERDLYGRNDLASLLRIRALADVLDLLSGGAFHRMMRARGRRGREP